MWPLMDPGKTSGKSASSYCCGISMPTVGACKHSFGRVTAATSKLSSPSVEADGLPMQHRSFEHPANAMTCLKGQNNYLTSGVVMSYSVRRCKLTITHLICFASIVGQCQDLHWQGFCTNAANQFHKVPCVLQIICTATCLCKTLS